MPPADPAHSDELSDVRTLLQAWPLGTVTHLKRALGGATNRVYRVPADRQQAFLRIYRRPDRALVEREHALLAWLRARALPVVPLIPANTGATLVEHAGTFAALYAPAPGSQLAHAQLIATHAYSAGATLARIHYAVADLPDAGYLRWTLSWTALHGSNAERR